MKSKTESTQADPVVSCNRITKAKLMIKAANFPTSIKSPVEVPNKFSVEKGIMMKWDDFWINDIVMGKQNVRDRSCRFW